MSSIKRKIDFIEWLCEEHIPVEPKAVWFLNQLIDHALLDKINFVEQFNNEHIQIQIVSFDFFDKDIEDFKCTINGKDIIPRDLIYHLLNVDKSKAYIKFYFKGCDESIELKNIIKYENQITFKDLMLEITIEREIKIYKKRELLKAIDNALDIKDKELFLNLTSELLELDE